MHLQSKHYFDHQFSILHSCFGSISLDDILVVMFSLKLGLHLGKLMLDSIELHTCLFTILFDSSNFIFFFSELQVNTLVLIGQLLRQSILQTGHQRL